MTEIDTINDTFFNDLSYDVSFYLDKEDRLNLSLLFPEVRFILSSNTLLEPDKNEDFSLNYEQRVAYASMLRGENVFLTGPGGVGKSLIIKLFYRESINFRNVALTAATGIAAFNIGGVTLHSFLGIGLGDGSAFFLENKIKKSPFYRKRYKDLEVLIIDEISMISPELLDKIELLARKIRRNDLPFGGIQVICSGDFLQLPPVKNDKFCFESESWKKLKFKVCNLTEILRQNDPVFQNLLNEIRLGKPTPENLEILRGCIGKKLEIKDGIKPTKIFPVNWMVDNLNQTELEKLNKDLREYEMEVNVNPTMKIDPERYLKNMRVERSLLLCEGAQVVLLCNIDTLCGLVNGSRGVITRFADNDIPYVKFLNGMEILVDYHEWTVMENDAVIISIEQIPLKLAWATTIHSCQGLTLDYIELSLKDTFEYGQFYVALSRARNIKGLTILEDFSDKKIRAHPKALEFYKSLEK